MPKALTLEDRRHNKRASISEVARETGIERTSVHLHHKSGRMPTAVHCAAYARYYRTSQAAILRGCLRAVPQSRLPAILRTAE